MINEADLIIEENNLYVVVAHHWDKILQIRHMTAIMRLAHVYGRERSSEDEKKQAHEYVQLIEGLMKHDGVEPVDPRGEEKDDR